ncbi:MAG: PQQ-dependent sugar dehydrogenase [Sedimentisphaerales bacterium]|nr:PQQ-dependent sugar dehydrogenase [Sedimentisphaerales bacterium]
MGLHKKSQVISGTLFIFLFTGFLAAQTPDVSWVFGNISSSSYRLDSFSPPEANLGPIGGADPSLNVKIGKRYQVTVTDFGFHPIDIIGKGLDATGDSILLSARSGINPVWESDAGVAWTDNGAGTVQFTLTLDLYNAMIAGGRIPGYRCGFHPTTMRGNFAVTGLPLEDPIPDPIDKGPIVIELEPVAEGLAAPVHLEEANDGTGRIFIVDQPGQVWILQNGSVLPEPFLDVSARLVSPLGILGSHDENDFDERGLLGLALHPHFADTGHPGYGKVYTYSSEPVDAAADFTTAEPVVPFNHQSVVAEWTVDAGNPDRIDPASRREIMRIDEPQFNHNAGMLAFGKDGYLYIAIGDGGAADDQAPGHGPTGNGQNIETVHGSILRIDPLAPAQTPDSADPVSVNGAYRVPASNPRIGIDGVDEIYAWGFRNPFRFSFDRLTGELIVGDVGQNYIEEVDIVQQGGNYGWNLKEGSFRFDPVTGTVTDDLSGLPAGLIDPVAQYDHDEGISIIGGYVYRGSAIPELNGIYVFGDFSTAFSVPLGRLFWSDLSNGQIQEFVLGGNDRAFGLFLKGFGQDADEELYVLASSNLGPYGTGGVVLKVVDVCSQRLPGDLNHDCVVNLFDFSIFAADWLICTHRIPELCNP